jgi:sec-independent protein translocase protein TatA
MSFVFLFGMLGGWEWLVIIMAILLLFGGKKIPELMRGVGQGIREFNRARATVESEIRQGMREEDRKKLEEDRKED